MGKDTEDQTTDLMELAVSDPQSAIAEADRRLGTATGNRRAETLRGRGVAQRRLGDLAAGRADLETALELVDIDIDPNLWAMCALSLGATRFLQGDVDDGLALMVKSVDISSGEVQAEAAVQLASAHGQMGNLAAAEATYSAVLPQVRALGMRAVEGQLLANRAIVLDYQGDLIDSLNDSAAADLIYRENSEWTNAAQNMANRASTFFRLGEIPTSLESAREADELISRTDVDPATFGRAKCETLMAAGLFAEALSTAKQAAEFHDVSQERLAQVEAMALASEAALALGERELATRLARATSTIRGADAVSAMHARAKLVGIRARTSEGEMSLVALQTALDLATEMREHGRPLGAIEATLEAARIALAIGDASRADALLSECAAATQEAPIPVQVQRWELVARLRGSVGDDRGMLSAVDAGLRSVEQLYESVGSFELRARAAVHGRELQETAARVLLRRGDAVRLGELITRRRGATLPLAPFSPSESTDQLDSELALLRQAEAEHRRSGSEATRLALASAQRALTVRSRTAAGSSRQPVESSAMGESDQVPGLQTEESLLILSEIDDELIAVHRQSHDAELHSCGPTSEVFELVEESAYLTRQLSRAARLSATAREHLESQHRAVAAELSGRLLPTGLAPRVLISAPGALQQLAWGALPGLSERPHCLTPSLGLARRPSLSTRKGTFVAGSDALRHVTEEVQAVAAIHEVEGFTNPGFSDFVASAGCAVWHLAGHFIANGDNPMFSFVELGDLDLHAHHVLGSGLAPEIAVLSACNTSHGEDTGGGQLGFAHALLAAGTSSVIMTSSLLEDSPATVETMTELHQQLTNNVPAADALAALRVNGDTNNRASRTGLTVLGVGWPSDSSPG